MAGSCDIWQVTEEKVKPRTVKSRAEKLLCLINASPQKGKGLAKATQWV